MDTSKTYIPVSCDLVDQIEILATSKKSIELVYLKMNKEVAENIQIRTWETLNKEEFLITKQGDRIRLDYILSLNGNSFENSCSIAASL